VKGTSEAYKEKNHNTDSFFLKIISISPDVNASKLGPVFINN